MITNVIIEDRMYQRDTGVRLQINAEPGTLAGLAVGDNIDLAYVLTADHVQQINQLPASTRTTCVELPDGTGTIMIPCRVRDRRHTLGSIRPGVLSFSRTTIYVVVSNGWYQDILLWLERGMRPEWAAPKKGE